MIKKRYKAILLDLFGTVVLFDEEKLPRVRLNGLEFPSTAERLHKQLIQKYPEVSLEIFCERLFEVREEIQRGREKDHREVSSSERFRRLLKRLGLSLQNGSEQLAEEFTREHMEWLKRCVEFPADHLPILQRLNQHHPLALISNFDHTLTGYQILEEYRLVPYFRTILFSDEMGWCKPHPLLFTTALERLGVTADEALFVGDTPELDILGPKNLGMDVAWIDRHGSSLPPFCPEPNYRLERFTDLAQIIE